MLKPIKKLKVHEHIATQIEELIALGDLRDGDELPAERMLMNQFEVGRPAVREALLLLERSGLLRLSNGERAKVSRPTAASVLGSLSASVRVVMAEDEGMRNFQAARTMFEVSLVRHAAKHATPEQINCLRAALKRNHEAIGDLREFEKTDVAFHYQIVLIVGNPIFSGIHEALLGWLTEQRSVALLDAAVDQQAYDFHLAIFSAIAAHDADRAEDAMRQHLDSVVATFWKLKNQERIGNV